MEQTSEKSASCKYRALLIGIGLLVLNAYLVFSLYGFNVFFSGLTFISLYFLAGLYCGKHCHDSSWTLGWWLAIPLAATAIIPLIIIFAFPGGGGRGALGLFFISAWGIAFSFAAFFSSSAGASFGESKTEKKGKM